MNRRASGRIAGQEPVSYDDSRTVDRISRREEGHFARTWGSAADEEGAHPEVYTEEHVKALGTADKEWTINVDAVDSKTGKRVYDPVAGKTCHQCRQKTIGRHTECTHCKEFQGNFCGDCIWMRYGENVDEIKAAGDWACPVCRDICNCSIHRNRRGWAPTGSMFHRALGEGFKSVAHRLVLLKAEDAVKRRVLSGELKVKGGYPKAWADATKAALGLVQPPPLPTAAAAGTENVAPGAKAPPPTTPARAQQPACVKSAEKSAAARTPTAVAAKAPPASPSSDRAGKRASSVGSENAGKRAKTAPTRSATTPEAAPLSARNRAGSSSQTVKAVAKAVVSLPREGKVTRARAALLAGEKGVAASQTLVTATMRARRADVRA